MIRLNLTGTMTRPPTSHFITPRPCSAALGLLVALTCLASGCAHIATSDNDATSFAMAFSTADSDSLFSRYAPTIITEQAQMPYNRIGEVSARINPAGNEELYINPKTPVFYTQRQDFSTHRGIYTNLIYRLHFEQVPMRFWPFNLTAGSNGGLLIIVTLNHRYQPVLITTVHTCGCYLAFVPTSYLPDSALPPHWTGNTQDVYGETLPRRLIYPDNNPHERLGTVQTTYRTIIELRGDTHRIKDVSLNHMPPNLTTGTTALRPMSSLLGIPFGEATISFYHTNGPDQGYVKNARKPFEFLFMSWWAWDSHVGVDKQLGDSDITGTVFYTSLKPWAREASDLWPFSHFLDYWGWQL